MHTRSEPKVTIFPPIEQASVRIGELFGDDAKANVIGFSGALQGIPKTLEGMKTTFDGLGMEVGDI